MTVLAASRLIFHSVTYVNVDIVCASHPPSGLDSYAALEIIKLLRQLADEGCTVMSVVHQPSSEIFAAFDKVMPL